MKIVILDNYTLAPDDEHWEPLRGMGEVQVFDRTNPSEIVERSLDAEIVLTNKVPLTRDTLNQLPKLKYVGVLATGYNLIDLEETKKRGIVVSNVPAYSSASVAQLVFALLLELVNGTSTHSNSVRKGDWQNCPDFSYSLTPLIELDKMSMGIVGMGNIGQSVAKIAQSFGMKVNAFSRTHRPFPGVEYLALDELLQTSDVISLHCPMSPETENLVNEDFLGKMKDSAFLINTSRGGLVDEAALANALNEGEIAGAGLDVLSTEPPKETNPLITASNCIITPHIGWATQAAKKRLIQTVVENVSAFLSGKPKNQVN